MIVRLFVVVVSLGILAGCAQPGPVTAAATSDKVLAAQYRAQSEHGAMSGVEVGIVSDAYQKNISAIPPDTTGSTTDSH